MQITYNPLEIESEVQDFWAKNNTFQAKLDPNKEKFYCLAMLPYPSGKLHMGHVRNYTISDVISRFHRMQGKNVLQPMGWDAFGLPAETAAVNNNISPKKWTYENIASMKKQLQILGFSYDWNREITTCDPSYYRFEQWFFIELFKKGLAYKKTSLVNWCEFDKTVLANEQVIDGKCWRCDQPIVQKKIPQWFLKITDYADELLKELDNLPDWPEQVKLMQKNWIGKSQGLEIDFQIENSEKKIKVYTTRADTFYGVSYLAIAADHELAIELAKENNEVKEFITKCQQNSVAEADLATLEKLGCFTNLYALHPITNEQIPIWIANFVLASYGTGAIMAVPAHDERDFEFANKYNLPIKAVIVPENADHNFEKQAFTNQGLMINSKEFNGLKSNQAKKEISEKLISLKVANYKVNFRLRDWGISRQRYWGAPIPMLNLNDETVVAEDLTNLPVELPDCGNNINLDTLQSTLRNNKDWYHTTHEGRSATRETDTFDTFIESSWYYARYTCPNAETMLESNEANYWLPVDQYVGGIEHATMHLLYFRFFHKLMRDLNLVDSNEPAKRLLCQGMVLNNAFYYLGKQNERIWVSPLEVTIEKDAKGNIIKAIDSKGNKLVSAGMMKMSKSKNNGIDPENMVQKYGADTVRLFTMFAAPPEMNLEWQESGVQGAKRFLKRVWTLVNEFSEDLPTTELDLNTLTNVQKLLRKELHKTIAKVTDDISRRQTFNTAIAAIMDLVNKIAKFEVKDTNDKALIFECWQSVILMLSPFVPHICFKLWQKLGKGDALDFAPWPKFDNKALEDDEKLIIIQINGKVRAKITVPTDTPEDTIKSLALAEPNVAKFLQNGTIIKQIYVPNKMLSFAIKVD